MEEIKIKKYFRKISYKNNLAILVFIYSLMFAAAILFYVINTYSLTYKNKDKFFLPTFILGAVLVFSLYLLIKDIYIPIFKLEKTIKLIESGDLELKNNINLKGGYSFNESLNKILIKLKDSMDREYMAKILKKQAEINSLQSQINPHFLYNTLEAIRGQALVENSYEIAEMTEALSRIFRYSISKNGNLVSIKDEIKNVENYFLIQQFRFNNKFNLSIIYSEEEALEYFIPKLTIEPIVENSICHGLEKKLGEGKIEIRITATNRRLIINISDDGIGIDKKSLEKINERLKNNVEDIKDSVNDQHTGIALINVNERIKLCFGNDYGVAISSTLMMGTDVEIVVPLVKEDGKYNMSMVG